MVRVLPDGTFEIVEKGAETTPAPALAARDEIRL